MATSNSNPRGFAFQRQPVAAKVVRPSSHPEMKIVLTHDQIAKMAYEVWLRKGQRKGEDERTWREAGKMLLKTMR